MNVYQEKQKHIGEFLPYLTRKYGNGRINNVMTRDGITYAIFSWDENKWDKSGAWLRKDQHLKIVDGKLIEYRL